MSENNTSCCSCKCGSAFRFFVLGLLLFLVGGVLTLAVKCRLQRPDAYEAQRAANRLKIRADLEAQAKELLTTPGWTDQSKGVVRISLEDAMALEIVALKQKTPHAAYAVGASVPIPGAAAPAAPAAATPASQPQPAPKK